MSATGDQAPDPLAQRTPRAREIIAAARRLLASEGWEATTMRTLAADLGIRAPSLYHHVASRDALRVALCEVALAEMGTALRQPLPGEERYDDPVAVLLRRYRERALREPELYRLTTAGRLPRQEILAGLEDWSGEPFLTVTGDPYRAQALWAGAHGLVILEIDGRLPTAEAPRPTWEALGRAFARAER